MENQTFNINIDLKIDNAKRLFRISSFTTIASIIIGLLIVLPGIVYEWVGLDTYSIALLPFILTTVFSISAAFYAVFAENAAIESEEQALLEKRKKHLKSTFDAGEDVRFTSQRFFQNYNKFAPYTLCILGFIISGAVLFALRKYWIGRPDELVPAKPLQAGFLTATLTLFSLFIGAFCVGESRQKYFRWLRPVGAWFIVGALTCAAATVILIMYHFRYTNIDQYARQVFFILYIIMGAEFLIDFVIEFYRPRTMEEERLVFENRLIGLFLEPGGLMRNIAETLDYQFGFKVSKTWIYGFFERSLIPLILFWLISLWLFTSIAQIGPNEVGVREWFGKRESDTPLKAGIFKNIHFKLPWPFGNIACFAVYKIKEFVVGPKLKKDSKTSAQVILWTKQHYAKESRFLVAAQKLTNLTSEAPVSFLGASFPIQYKIKPNEIVNFAYKYEDADKVLKNVAEKVITKYLASVDFIKIMSLDRESTVKDLKRLIQKEADKLHLGVEIVTVNFHDAHPPVDKVSPVFQEVIGALENKHTTILKAEASRIKTRYNTLTEVKKLQLEAEAYKTDAIRIAEAEASRFKKQYLAYKEMPEMFKLRTYLDLLESSIKNIRIYVLSDSLNRQIYEINLEEKVRWDLLDVDVSDLTEKK